MSDVSVPIGSGGYLFPGQSPTTSDHGSGSTHTSYAGESHSDHYYSAGGHDTGSHEDHHEPHAHVITDFGIGTLVLAMTLGALSRTYLTHVTG